MHRGSAILLVFITCCGLGRPAQADELRVGYRVDALPFSFCGLDKPMDCESSAPWSELRFDGFIAGICDFIFEDNGLNPETVGVTATTRIARMESENPGTRIDMLCDSTSVTLKRSRSYLFSPVVFASGVSYVVSNDVRKREEAAYVASVSSDGKTKADFSSLPRVPNCVQMEAAGVLPVFRVGVLADTTAVEAVKHEQTQRLFRLNRGADRGERICIEEVPNGGYLEGIRRLCEGEFSYFFGDRDLLVRRLEIYLAGQKDEAAAACDAELSSAFFSFEPYAIAVRADRPELFLKVQTSVLKFFSDPESVRTLFAEKFGEEARPSGLVSSLFQLNSLGQVD